MLEIKLKVNNDIRSINKGGILFHKGECIGE